MNKQTEPLTFGEYLNTLSESLQHVHKARMLLSNTFPRMQNKHAKLRTESMAYRLDAVYREMIELINAEPSDALIELRKRPDFTQRTLRFNSVSQ